MVHNTKSTTGLLRSACSAAFETAVSVIGVLFVILAITFFLLWSTTARCRGSERSGELWVGHRREGGNQDGPRYLGYFGLTFLSQNRGRRAMILLSPFLLLIIDFSCCALVVVVACQAGKVGTVIELPRISDDAESDC